MTDSRFHVQCIMRRLRPIERTLPTIEAVMGAGIGSIQLRDEAASMTAMIQAIKRTPSWDRERLVVNGDPKVAGEFGLRWLHLPSQWIELTPPFGRFARVGISVHSLEEAIEAEALGADYVTFGHIYSSLSHPDEAGRGLDALAGIVERLAIPVLAIGGIDHANIGEVVGTGCAGAVVISAIVDHPDPGHAARQLIDTAARAEGHPKVALPPMPASANRGSSQ